MKIGGPQKRNRNGFFLCRGQGNLIQGSPHPEFSGRTGLAGRSGTGMDFNREIPAVVQRAGSCRAIHGPCSNKR